MFGLTDYDKKLNHLLSFYPVLMRSYTEKAIENYIRPVILNYHNQFSRTERNEEIFYQRTNRVILSFKKDDHFIWPTSKEEMLKDRMFYEFKDPL